MGRRDQSLISDLKGTSFFNRPMAPQSSVLSVAYLARNLLQERFGQWPAQFIDIVLVFENNAERCVH
jgi:hypothetical protein